AGRREGGAPSAAGTAYGYPDRQPGRRPPVRSETGRWARSYLPAGTAPARVVPTRRTVPRPRARRSTRYLSMPPRRHGSATAAPSGLTAADARVAARQTAPG